MTKFKPGEVWSKHQEKMKKKHEKHMKRHKSVADQPSMKGFNPSAKAKYPTKITPNVNFNEENYGGGPKNSSMKMAKRMHSKHRKHKKNWIQGAIKHPGALHEELGVKQGHKIPAKTLTKAAKKGGKVGARARLAETLKGFHHKKHEKKEHMHEKHHKMGKHCKTCSCE